MRSASACASYGAPTARSDTKTSNMGKGLMPTYEYVCSNCGHAFEQFQRISDAPLEVCPECGGRVRRLISRGGGLVFKGPGFYATDYGSSKGGDERSSAKKDAGKSEAGGSGESGKGSSGDGG